jgi:hypothetical protein
MKHLYLIVVVVVVLGLALAVMAGPSVMANDRDGPKVIDRDSVAYGRTYSELSAEWLQWAISIPVAHNPNFDNGDCSIGQSGPVWFLGTRMCQAGAPGCNMTATRSCSVPARKALLFPIMWVEDSAPEEPAFGCGSSFPPLISGTTSEMRQCVQSILNYILTGATLEADVDGKTIGKLWSFRVQSPAFEFTMPADNVLNAIGEGPFPAGTYSPVVSDGMYLLLPPLSAGSHTVHFGGTFPNAVNESITYNLTVAK